VFIVAGHRPLIKGQVSLLDFLYNLPVLNVATSFLSTAIILLRLVEL
jgi:hypothetical protein